MRLYFLGVLKARSKTMPPLKIKSPKGPPKPLRKFLSTVPPADTRRELSETARRSIKRAKVKFPNPDQPVIVDAGASRKFSHATMGEAPTLTSSRCASQGYYWLQAAEKICVENQCFNFLI